MENISHEELKKLQGVRKDRWHKEKPNGPYYNGYSANSGYDLGHLTPSKITMYSDSLNYHSLKGYIK